MDATPVTLGQEFGGYARQVRLGIERIQSALPRVAEVPLGGTATGTGINTPKGFSPKVIAIVAETSGLPITEALDHFEAQGARDGLVEASGALRVIAVSLTKICNDLRWMGSGPNTGLAELSIPDLQPGSSIMPGKVNPVIPEAVIMVGARVIGNDATIAWAGATGNFELNVAIPVMGTALLESIRLLTNSSRLLADKTVDGLEANVERSRALAESSPSIVTPLNKFIGYENAAKIAKHSVKKGLTVREATIDLGFVERGEITARRPRQGTGCLVDDAPGLRLYAAQSCTRWRTAGRACDSAARQGRMPTSGMPHSRHDARPLPSRPRGAEAAQAVPRGRQRPDGRPVDGDPRRVGLLRVLR